MPRILSGSSLMKPRKMPLRTSTSRAASLNKLRQQQFSNRSSTDSRNSNPSYHNNNQSGNHGSSMSRVQSGNSWGHYVDFDPEDLM
eukprot:CAMPEP_0119567158 /NCGR_PEP_ID=MMETSP1352-20130426/35158_1 /TAXON_ID=265584 /ORGANISM="Stauroneis constricta, Strain CCMP1120" /LENGTH=85 /DNA_ID=CAMNT_0007616375 /DNA_START=67 /DNA_END=324 /DNA_ORIENTATION=-